MTEIDDQESLDVSGGLRPWSEVVGQGPWPSILLGNGASRAVWEKFAYPSLFNAAKSLPLDHKLLPEDEALFDSLNTEIFEVVLRALALSDRVTKQLKIPAPIISQRYDWIRAALIEAVRSVHPPWELVPLETRERIGKHLRRYQSIYSTNYDLLVYWSRMSVNDGKDFKDFLWFDRFDLTDAGVQPDAQCVFNLHGGLHLFRRDGKTYKMSRKEGGPSCSNSPAYSTKAGFPFSLARERLKTRCV